MNELVKALRDAAKAQPINAMLLNSAADEIELLESVRDIFDAAPEVDHALTDAELSKIKAEAVSEVAEMSFIDDAFTYQMIKAHAKKTGEPK